MRLLYSTIVLLALAGSAQAHVADLAPLAHALEHGWLVLLLAPLLALLPAGRGRR